MMSEIKKNYGWIFFGACLVFVVCIGLMETKVSEGQTADYSKEINKDEAVAIKEKTKVNGTTEEHKNEQEETTTKEMPTTKREVITTKEIPTTKREVITTKKNSYKNSWDDDSYDAGYEDVYYNEDYDWDRYHSDSDYAKGVDDAIDEGCEEGEWEDCDW